MHLVDLPDLFAKLALRKFIGEQASGVSNPSEPAVKLEAFIAEQEEALIANGWSKNGGGRGRSPYVPYGSPQGSRKMRRSNNVKGNPPGPDGNLLSLQS